MKVQRFFLNKSSSTAVMTAETPIGGKNVMNNNFMNAPLFSWVIFYIKSILYDVLCRNGIFIGV